jgi:hypothetical protein
VKALSIKQPWAELIASGKKSVELRTWNTSYRGKFLVHASKTPDALAMQRFGFTALPLGFVVGRARLDDTKKYCSMHDLLLDEDKHLASQDDIKRMYKASNKTYHGFVLSQPKRIKPFKTKGRLGFFDVMK